MQAQLDKLGSYDAATKTAGPLLGDALLRSIEQDMRRALTSPVAGSSGDYTTLASIGITTNADGTLELDAAKLKKALDRGLRSRRQAVRLGERRCGAAVRAGG